MTTCSATKRAYDGPCVREPGHVGDHANATGDRWHNYGPVDRYEVVWMSGHVETVAAHQISYPEAGLALAGLSSLGTRVETGPPRIRMHAEIDGRWVLTLQALEEDIRTIRLVTDGERMPGGAA